VAVAVPATVAETAPASVPVPVPAAETVAVSAGAAAAVAESATVAEAEAVAVSAAVAVAVAAAASVPAFVSAPEPAPLHRSQGVLASGGVNFIRVMMDGLRPVIRARRAIFGPRRPTWTLELETVAEVLRRSSTFSAVMPLQIQRRVIDPPRPVTAPMRQVQMTPLEAGGVSAEWFSQPQSDPDRVVLYFHGGGYSTGSINSHRDFLARLCIASGMRVLAADYRLAPEHPFPAQLEDSHHVYRWLIEERGIHPDHIILGGESAGAGLTLSTLVSLRDERLPLPAGGVLISGWFDLDSRSTSMQFNRHYDFVTRIGIRAMAKRYAPIREHGNPLVSPVHAELQGLPPLLIQVGAAETLLDDSLRVAERARSAGVEVKLEVWPDMIHAWHVFAPMLEEGRQAIERIGEFVKQRTR
jgi:monoterpene epsilon-lactone hydrolase